MIKLSNVKKKFGNYFAVNDLSVEINPGELYGFLGPNGAGKTTTIKMMTGLYTPTSGSITIDKYDTQKQPLEAKSVVGYIPDQPFLYEKLTGREFLYFSGGLHKIPYDAIKRKIEELGNIFEISPWLDQRTEYYSQGMRQRVVIVSALIHDPKVLIIDEPMVGLDPKSAHIVKNNLMKRVREGVTIFMSTHSLSIVEEICTRIGIIKEGRLIYDENIDSFKKMRDNMDGKFESVFLELTK